MLLLGPSLDLQVPMATLVLRGLQDQVVLLLKDTLGIPVDRTRPTVGRLPLDPTLVDHHLQDQVDPLGDLPTDLDLDTMARHLIEQWVTLDLRLDHPVVPPVGRVGPLVVHLEQQEHPDLQDLLDLPDLLDLLDPTVHLQQIYRSCRTPSMLWRREG